MDDLGTPMEGSCEHVTIAQGRPRRTAWRQRRSPRGAVLLGATLALGSATLGCGRDPHLDSKLPDVSTDSQPLFDEPADGAAALPEPEPMEQLETAQLRVGPGFTPDPLTREGTTAGGPVDASERAEGCEGWIGRTPDLVLQAERPFAELTLMVASAEPTLLVVAGPDGITRCGAGPGTNATLRAPAARGAHRIWVGTRARDVRVPYVLGLSELDDRQPQQLLP